MIFLVILGDRSFIAQNQADLLVSDKINAGMR